MISNPALDRTVKLRHWHLLHRSALASGRLHDCDWLTGLTRDTSEQHLSTTLDDHLALDRLVAQQLLLIAHVNKLLCWRIGGGQNGAVRVLFLRFDAYIPLLVIVPVI